MNLGVAIPSSPGFVGTYQWLVISTLALYGVGREEGLAFAIVFQACWYIPTTVVGGALLALRAPARIRVSTPVSGHADSAHGQSVPYPECPDEGDVLAADHSFRPSRLVSERQRDRQAPSGRRETG